MGPMHEAPVQTETHPYTAEDERKAILELAGVKEELRKTKQKLTAAKDKAAVFKAERDMANLRLRSPQHVSETKQQAPNGKDLPKFVDYQHDRVQQLTKQLKDANDTIASLRRRKHNAAPKPVNEELTSLRKKLAAMTRSRDAWQEKHQTAQNQYAQMERKVKKLERRLAEQAKPIRDPELTREVAYIRDRLETLTKERDDADTKYRGQLQVVKTTKQSLQAANNEITALQNKIKELTGRSDTETNRGSMVDESRGPKPKGLCLYVISGIDSFGAKVYYVAVCVDPFEAGIMVAMQEMLDGPYECRRVVGKQQVRANGIIGDAKSFISLCGAGVVDGPLQHDPVCKGKG